VRRGRRRGWNRLDASSGDHPDSDAYANSDADPDSDADPHADTEQFR
jgi:hypothetical protein